MSSKLPSLYTTLEVIGNFALKIETWVAEALLTVVWVLLIACWTSAGYPVTLFVTHGFDVTLWPSFATPLDEWLRWLRAFEYDKVFEQYGLMAVGRNQALPWGGLVYFWPMAGTLGVAIFSTWPKAPSRDDLRDQNGILGSARWANAGELARMTQGLEIGRDPETQKPIRLRVEGNLLSVAPPRTGKTSGLIINNLLVPDDNAWNGPCFVIDPKGEVFTAVVRRRRELGKMFGRRVIKFDLRRGAKGHRWNPLAELHINDVAHFQRIASALVSDAGSGNKYFTERGGDIFTGMLMVALLEAQLDGRTASPADVARLLSNPDTALKIAENDKSQLMQSLAADLRMDEKARDQLISTARTGVKWLMDERFQRVTAESNFNMVQVARGKVDLFIVVPPGDAELLTPLLRWMFAEFFSAMSEDRHEGDSRIVMFVDEAHKLGGFNELKTALGLLPGLGVSIWTFWQSLAQIETNYGKSGAAEFTATAEVTTISNLAKLGDDAETVSKALGSYSALMPSTSEQTSKGNSSSTKSESARAVRLVTADQLTSMGETLLVLLNSKNYTPHPTKLDKIKYFDDERFKGLHDGVKPVGAL